MKLFLSFLLILLTHSGRATCLFPGPSYSTYFYQDRFTINIKSRTKLGLYLCKSLTTLGSDYALEIGELTFPGTRIQKSPSALLSLIDAKTQKVIGDNQEGICARKHSCKVSYNVSGDPDSMLIRFRLTQSGSVTPWVTATLNSQPKLISLGR